MKVIRKPLRALLFGKSKVDAKIESTKAKVARIKEARAKKVEIDSKVSEAREQAATLAELKIHLLAFGDESNIGQNDDYWILLNKYRGYISVNKG